MSISPCRKAFTKLQHFFCMPPPPFHPRSWTTLLARAGDPRPLQICFLTHLGHNLRLEESRWCVRAATFGGSSKCACLNGQPTLRHGSPAGYYAPEPRLNSQQGISLRIWSISDPEPAIDSLWKFIKLVISGTVQCKTISDSPPLSWFISTEGALRLPMTYDNHPIQPTQSHPSIHL